MSSHSGAQSAQHVRKLGRQSLLSLTGAAAGAAAGFGLVFFAVRGLDADEAGSALLAIAVFSVVARVAQLGTGTAFVHFMTREHARAADRELPLLMRLGLPRVVAASTLLAVGLYLFAGTLSGLVSINDSRDALTQSLRLAALFVPANAVMTVLLDATRGHALVKPTVVVGRIGRPVVQLLGIAIALAVGGGAPALTLAWTAPSAAGLLASAWWLRRIHRAAGSVDVQHSESSTCSITHRQFWAYSWPQNGVDSIRSLVRWQDGILIGVLLGAGPAAIYVAVTRLVKVASLANQAFAETISPHVGEALATGDRERAAFLYRASTSWLILLLGPIYLATAFYAKTFTSIFGAGYTDAALVLVILSFGKLAGTMVGSVEAILIVSGQTRINLGNHISSLVSNIVLNVVLVPWIGLPGAAISWAVSILITNYGPYLQLRARTSLSPFSATTVAVTGGVWAAVAVPAVIVNIGIGQTPISVACALMVSAAVLVAGAYHFRAYLHLDEVLGSRTGNSDDHHAVQYAEIETVT